MGKRSISEHTVDKMLSILTILYNKLLISPEMKLGNFCKENNVPGSFSKMVKDIGIVEQINRDTTRYNYKWATIAPNREMALDLVTALNNRAKNAKLKNDALKYAEQLRLTEQKIAEGTVVKKPVEKEIAVKQHDSMSDLVLREPVKKTGPTFTSPRSRPVVSKHKVSNDTVITTVTTYFVKWLKIKTVHTIKGK